MSVIKNTDAARAFGHLHLLKIVFLSPRELCAFASGFIGKKQLILVITEVSENILFCFLSIFVELFLSCVFPAQFGDKE